MKIEKISILKSRKNIQKEFTKFSRFRKNFQKKSSSIFFQFKKFAIFLDFDLFKLFDINLNLSRYANFVDTQQSIQIKRDKDFMKNIFNFIILSLSREDRRFKIESNSKNFNKKKIVKINYVTQK